MPLEGGEREKLGFCSDTYLPLRQSLFLLFFGGRPLAFFQKETSIG